VRMVHTSSYFDRDGLSDYFHDMAILRTLRHTNVCVFYGIALSSAYSSAMDDPRFGGGDPYNKTRDRIHLVYEYAQHSVRV
jgi:hypothetical protein